jgi:hypothetical protein
MFTRRAEGSVEFAKRKYDRLLLDDIARSTPDYLDWILGKDFFDDTKALAAEALRAAGRAFAVRAS